MKALSLVGAVGVISIVSFPVIAGAQPAVAESGRTMVTLPAMIPIFPLEDVVLFPNASVPLHIFEPRYREMVTDALQGDGIIGMVRLKPGYESDYYGRPPIDRVGCAGVITEAEELPDGRYLILLRGLVKFRVAREDHSRTYRLADVETIPELLDGQGQEALSERRRYLAGMLTAMSPDSEPLPRSLSDAEFVDRLAQALALSPTERQSLLEQEGLVARADALVDLVAARLSVPL